MCNMQYSNGSSNLSGSLDSYASFALRRSVGHSAPCSIEMSSSAIHSKVWSEMYVAIMQENQLCNVCLDEGRPRIDGQNAFLAFRHSKSFTGCASAAELRLEIQV